MLNNWHGVLRVQKKRNRTIPIKGRAFTSWKENKNVGTEPFFIGSAPKGVHSRLWTFLGTERIRLKRVKYRLHVKFCRSRSSFYPSRSNFFGRVNGPLVSSRSIPVPENPYLFSAFQNKIYLKSIRYFRLKRLKNHTLWGGTCLQSEQISRKQRSLWSRPFTSQVDFKSVLFLRWSVSHECAWSSNKSSGVVIVDSVPNTVFFNWVSKVIRVWFGFALLRSVIG